MKIGARLTFTTVSLVVLTLGLYGTVSVRSRRAELSADSARRLSSIGGLARVAVESTIKDGLFEDLEPLIQHWRTIEPEMQFSYIDLTALPPLGSGATETISMNGQLVYLPPSHDPSRQLRLQRAVVEGLPYGQSTEIDGRPVYAVMEPIRDGSGRIVGALDLARDEGETVRALRTSVYQVMYAVGGLGVMLALLVWLSAKGTISSPLERLVEAVGDVTRGDLGRVILRERDDEVGALAERFNEMTRSLREARTEILAGVDAKLALETRLRLSEKLATIGQLAAGIAHEVGTPLNVIGGRARNMEKRADEALSGEAALQPQDVAKNAGIIAAQTQRITKIIQQLLDFARRPQRVRSVVDLSKVTHDVLDFLEHQLAQAHVEVARPPYVGDEANEIGKPEVPGDSDQLQQVVLNLCVNAIQAMPTGGRLTVELRGLARRRPGLDAAPPGRFVMIAVSDTGMGIPEADRERIFEPFYTTKTPSENDPAGTGLGLAVSNGIVKDHDGWIELEAPQAGTVFRVFLPADA